MISLEENIAKLEKSILANNHNPHVTFAGTKNGSSSNGGNLRRSSSVTSETANDTTFFHKKKRSFNFPNVKKRYGFLQCFLTGPISTRVRTTFGGVTPIQLVMKLVKNFPESA